MAGWYHYDGGQSTAKSDLSFVPKLCPKYVRNIETYLRISKSIEIREPLKTRVSQGNYIIFYTLDFSAASYTR